MYVFKCFLAGFSLVLFILSLIITPMYYVSEIEKLKGSSAVLSVFSIYLFYALIPSFILFCVGIGDELIKSFKKK